MNKTTIYRAKHNNQNPFTRVSNNLIQDKRLKPDEKLTLVFILSNADKWVINQNNLKNQLGIKKTKMQRIIKNLENTGYLTREKFKLPDAKGFGWNWTVYENGQNVN